MSTQRGTRSMATPRSILASSSSSSSMAVHHSLTEVGMASMARRRTARFFSTVFSMSAAARYILTLLGMWRTAVARTVLEMLGGLRRAASSQTSSLSGQTSVPSRMMALACAIFPAHSSTLAAAIHPGPCLGLVSLTLLSKSLALLISARSALLVMTELSKLVRYPFGSTLVCPDTLSCETLSKLIPSTVPRASANPTMPVEDAAIGVLTPAVGATFLPEVASVACATCVSITLSGNGVNTSCRLLLCFSFSP
mmetsp:Transcript_14008/g.30734  ORF Transcript_14008/g.30734 Transcript_14008/m.30734 type:complete len:253 (+) Transcript_14008:63-821(+)